MQKTHLTSKYYKFSKFMKKKLTYLCLPMLFAETPLVSFWVTHWVCLILLMILCCGNSLLVRGVYIDGEEEGGQCVVFQVNYLRYHYKVSVFPLLYLTVLYFFQFVCNLGVTYSVFQYPNGNPSNIHKRKNSYSFIKIFGKKYFQLLRMQISVN
jgi:hypothetical protein